MKTLFKYLLMGVLAAIYLPLLTACDEEGLVDPYDINYIYIYPPSKTDNFLSYKGNGTFVVGIVPDLVINPARCTKPAPEELTIHVEIAPSLVDDYNQAHGTNYTLLKSAKLENATLTIKKGEYISADTLKVHYTDMKEFQNGAENFILPIAVTSISSSKVSASESSRIYLTFSSVYNANFVTIETTPTLNLEYEGGRFTNLIDRLQLDNILTSSWAADEDINVSLKIDKDLVDTYNDINGTNYILMPNAAFENSTVTIKKGNKTSGDALVLIFSDAMASVELGKDYLLPITVTDVDGIGAETGETLTTYLVFKTVESMSVTVGTASVGNAIKDFTGWSITVDGKNVDSRGDNWLELVTNPSSPYWMGPISKTNVMEIDTSGHFKLNIVL